MTPFSPVAILKKYLYYFVENVNVIYITIPISATLRSFFIVFFNLCNISNHGIWLYVKGTEYFLPFEDFPWFKEVKVGEI